MWTTKVLRGLHQLPVILAWRIAIFIAAKSSHRKIVVCDVTSTESKYRDRFAVDVKSILDDLALTSPELLQRLQKHVRYIARAGIINRFDYFVRPRLLLLHVDYENERSDLRSLIKRDLVEAATLADQRSQ
jgi:hypothetical protein